MFFRDLTFSHFGTILACDRQTDRKLECLMMWPCNIVTGPQYMPRYRPSIASRGKKNKVSKTFFVAVYNRWAYLEFLA